MSNPDAGSRKVQNVAHTFSILENLDMYRLWLRTAAVFPLYNFFSFDGAGDPQCFTHFWG